MSYITTYCRYGSLKRRSLISRKAWKSNFSEFHKSYSPRPGPRFSFRSPDKPRHSSLSRQSSSLGVSPQSVLLEYPTSESRDLDAESNYSEIHSCPAQEEAAAGNERKSGEDSNDVEEEKGTKENESEPQPPADGKKAPPSESSSELLNNSGDSESLELQLSAAGDGRLHIEEREDSPVELHTPKPNGVENGDVSGLRSDTKDLSLPLKVCYLVS